MQVLHTNFLVQPEPTVLDVSCAHKHTHTLSERHLGFAHIRLVVQTSDSLCHARPPTLQDHCSAPWYNVIKRDRNNDMSSVTPQL